MPLPCHASTLCVGIAWLARVGISVRSAARMLTSTSGAPTSPCSPAVSVGGAARPFLRAIDVIPTNANLETMLSSTNREMPTNAIIVGQRSTVAGAAAVRVVQQARLVQGTTDVAVSEIPKDLEDRMKVTVTGAPPDTTVPPIARRLIILETNRLERAVLQRCMRILVRKMVIRNNLRPSNNCMPKRTPRHRPHPSTMVEYNKDTRSRCSIFPIRPAPRLPRCHQHQ
jgi:hypothetical protein